MVAVGNGKETKFVMTSITIKFVTCKIILTWRWGWEREAEIEEVIIIFLKFVAGNLGLPDT